MTDFLARPLRIILLGPPASGKGTQGKRLAASLGLGYLSTGALLREQVELATELGMQAAPILNRGEYLPDALMFPILSDWLSHQESGWVLDGFPRSVPQAEFLDHWLTERDLKVDRAVSLVVPVSQLLARIQGRVECPECRWSGQRSQLVAGNLCPVCGSIAGPRADDDEAKFHKRYEEFQALTIPVLSYYAAQKLLCSCDATDAADVVATRLLHEFQASSV